jgi:hypothetical protein
MEGHRAVVMPLQCMLDLDMGTVLHKENIGSLSYFLVQGVGQLGF